MIRTLTCKNMNFFILMQAYCSKQEFDKLKLYCDPSITADLVNLTLNIPLFQNIEIIEKSDITENLVNKNSLVAYIKKYSMPYTKCKLSLQTFEAPDKFKDKKYIYVDEYYGDNHINSLEKCAIENDFLLYNQASFKKSIKNSLVDKAKHTITEKIGILQNAIGYLGFDYSLLSSVAEKYKTRKKIGIVETTKLSAPEIFFKFYPYESFFHFYNNVEEFASNFNICRKELKN